MSNKIAAYAPWLLAFKLVTASAVPSAWAAVGGADSPPATRTDNASSLQEFAQVDENLQRGVDQKFKTLDAILSSKTAAAIEAGDQKGPKTQLSAAKSLRESAAADIRSGDLKLADQKVTQALRLVAAASATMRNQPKQDSGKAKGAAPRMARFAELLEGVQAYRDSFMEAAQGRAGEAAGMLDLARLDSLLRDAARLADSGDFDHANKLLEEAYVMAEDGVTRLRNNETVVYSLNFQTPADEYRYERDRYDGYSMLVQRLVAEGRAKGTIKQMLDGYVEKAAGVEKRAANEAASGDYDSAIGSMEEASRHLARALTAMGIPVAQ